jgi:hypothetical protein
MNQDEYITLYPNIKKTINICSFKYNILEVKLCESVRIAVYLFNENGLMVDSRQYLINGNEYAAWSTDDKYIINLIKQKIHSGINFFL